MLKQSKCLSSIIMQRFVVLRAKALGTLFKKGRNQSDYKLEG